MNIIGHVYTDFNEKFGIPRQSNLIPSLEGKIIFEKNYRQPEAFNGLEEFEYIWILFQFDKSMRDHFYATVKPPRLGGNKKKGVFATRSPFRPNSIGLSSVKLEKIEYTDEFGPVIYISGIDILNGSPIYDIKPYLPYADSHPDAKAGFTDDINISPLTTNDPDGLLNTIPADKRENIIKIISEDPRPGYQDDPQKIYKMAFSKWDIHFTISNHEAYIKKVLLIN